MKKILKKEVLIAFIIGLIIASSITIYAYSYVASDIKYTKKDGTEISIETALNELYNEQKNTAYIIEGFASTRNNGANASTMTIEVNKNLSKAILIYSAGNGDSGNDAYSLFKPTEIKVSSENSNVTLLQSKTDRAYGNTYSGSSAQELYCLENLSVGDIITIVGYHRWGGFAFATLVSYGTTE